MTRFLGTKTLDLNTDGLDLRLSLLSPNRCVLGVEVVDCKANQSLVGFVVPALLTPLNGRYSLPLRVGVSRWLL